MHGVKGYLLLTIKRGITYRNIVGTVMGLVINDVDTDGKNIFQVSK
jgi:hypothetical protein